MFGLIIYHFGKNPENRFIVENFPLLAKISKLNVSQENFPYVAKWRKCGLKLEMHNLWEIFKKWDWLAGKKFQFWAKLPRIC